MTRPAGPAGAAPVWAWTLLSAGLAGGCAVAAVAGVALAGGMREPLCVVAAALGVSVGALAALALGLWWGARLRRLAVAVSAVSPAPEATDPAGADRLAVPPVRELAAVLHAVAVLQRRVRMADGLAERHRRAAEAASSGIFELISGLISAEEGARGQLAAELHDTVAQSLLAARRLLAEFDHADAGSVGADRDERLARVSELVTEAEEALRATMARTRPPALRDGDLASAVNLLREEFAFRYGLRVQVSWPSVEYPVPLATAVTVYRFFQEALVNVVKHADVDEASLALEVDARDLVATVSDAGPGFDVAAWRASGSGGRHVGLGLLRERARLAGGSVEVDSAPGRGTTLLLRLPRPAMPVGRPQVVEPRRPSELPPVEAS